LFSNEGCNVKRTTTTNQGAAGGLLVAIEGDYGWRERHLL
jgi:hypothetical protein